MRILGQTDPIKPKKREYTKEEQQLIDTPDMMLSKEALALKKELLGEVSTEAVADPELAPGPNTYISEEGYRVDLPEYGDGSIQATPAVEFLGALAAAPGGLALLGEAITSAYSPATKPIPALQGVAAHDVLTTMGLAHAIKETPEAVEEFIEEPSLGQAAHIVWDASMGAPAMRGVYNRGKSFVGGFKEGYNRAKGMVADDIIEAGGQTIKELPGAERLRQIMTKEPAALLPVGKPTVVKNKPKKAKLDLTPDYDYSNVSMPEEEPAGFRINKQRVYQYPSFIQGSKLEKQVGKDGTISRKVLEAHANNKNTVATEANAVKDLLAEYDEARIDYKEFKELLATTIGTSSKSYTGEHGDVGVEELGYGMEADRNTILFKSGNLPTAAKHFTKDNSFWIRNMINSEEPNVYYVLEMQTDVNELKDATLSKPAAVGNDELNMWLEKYDLTALKPTTLDDQLWAINQTMRLADPSEYAQLEALAEKIEDASLASPDYSLAKARNKGLPLKMVNEAVLDAAQNGQDVIRFPTTETVFTIEGWDNPNNGNISLDEIKAYDFPSEAKPYINERLTSYEQKETEISEAFDERQEIINEGLNRFNDTFEDYGIIATEEDIFGFTSPLIDRIETLIDKSRESIAKAKTPDEKYLYETKVRKLELELDKWQATVEYADELESFIDVGYDNLKWLESDLQNLASPFIKRSNTINVSNMTDSQKSVTRDYRNFPKLWKKEFGTEVRQVTDSKGNTWYEVDVPNKFKETEGVHEIKHYDKGGILKALAKQNRKSIRAIKR